MPSWRSSPAVTLDGKMRLAVWIFLGGLALRTVIHMKAQE